KISSATISKTSSGQYYCSILVTREIQEYEPTKKEVGIDLGIKTLAVDSDGNEYENIRPLRNLQRKLKRKQRKLSKRRHKTSNKRSNRISKQQRCLAKMHQKNKNIRNDYLHKISKKLIDKSQVICLEDLSVKNMVRNHKLA